MGIDVLARGSDGYEANRGAFNVLLSQDPARIVTPRDARDVADAIAYAKAEALRIGAQRTGHSAEPLGDLSDTLLLRTAAMSGVSIDADRRIARVGSGALWGDLVPQASDMGFAAAHVLDLASRSQPLSFGRIDLDALTSVHATDAERLRSRLGANLGLAETPGGN